MTRSQFIFSLGSGISLACAGFALATGGFADWGLFWVGVTVSSVALVYQLKPTQALLPALAKTGA